MQTVIRPAAFTDAPRIAEFNRLIALETERRELDPATVLSGVENCLREPARGFYLVAERGGVVVGQLMITYEWSDWRNGNFWWVQSVYVAASARRGGVCRALFDHVRALALKDPAVCGLRLYHEVHNAQAQKAYLSFGFADTPYRIMEWERPQ